MKNRKKSNNWKNRSRLEKLFSKAYFHFSLSLLFSFSVFLMILINLSLQISAQDIFISKYGLDKESIASIAILIYESPIFVLPDSISSFIKNNKNQFDKLLEFYKNNIDIEMDLDIDKQIYDAASASIEFNRIKEVLKDQQLNEFKLFLLDFANLLFYKNDLCVSLENFFKELAKENIFFSNIPITLSTNENLFLHIKQPKKSIDQFIFFSTDNLNNLLYELLKFVFKQRLFFTTILPKSIEFNKVEQARYLNLTSRAFLYPELENMLESTFTLYSLSNIIDQIYKYTGLSIKENVEANTFYYKVSWLNEIIKRWDELNNNSIFKFPRPYGQIFVEFIKNDNFELPSLNSFDRLLQLNPDTIAIISLANDLKISDKQKNLVQKKLLKIGFSKVIFKFDYEKNTQEFLNKKIVFITLMNKNSENISPFYIINNNNFQLQDILIKSFTEISAISYFDNINILLLINKTSTDSLMKVINLIPKLKLQPIILKRSFFQIIIDKIISFFSPLSL